MRKVLFILFILLKINFGWAQNAEICNNGIDDDGDGLIDLNDPDCHCDGFSTTTSEIPSFIPNPSFEEMNCCPSSFSQMSCASHWDQASDATSDYQNMCGYVMQAAYEVGLVPPPDGAGFVGAIYSQGWQEYVGACLTQPMHADSSYTISFSIASVPIAAMGSACNGGAINYGPIDVTIFGTPNCGDLPFSGTDCPVGHGQWMVLGSTNYTPENQWSQIEITFTPPVDINAIIIGSPCNLPSGYVGGSCYPYFVYDNLILNRSDAFGSINITATGNLCTNDMVLYSHANLSGDWQWYYNGVAIVGQTDSILNVSVLGYGNGTYQARLSNEYGCEVAEYTINSSFPTVQIDSVNDVTCYGQNNGSIYVTVTGDTLPLTYNWSGPNGFTSTSEDLSNLSSGTYSLTVADDSGCTATITTTINEPPQLLLTSSITDEQCPGYANGSIDVTVSGGTEPYTYNWSTGATTEDIDNLTQGSYTVTVTDSNGCIIIRTYQVNTLYPIPTSDFTIDSVWCYQDTTTVQYTGNATSAGNYHWDFGGASIVSGAGQGPYRINWLSPGFYNVSLWVEENGCVSDTTVATIQNPPQLTVSLTAQDLLCYHDNTGQVTTQVSGGVPQYSYLWSNGSNDSTLYNISAGNYSLLVTDSRGCKAVSSVVVNEPDELVVSTPSYIQHCNGLPLTIESSVTGGTLPYTYSWSNGSTSSSITINPTEDVTVSVTVIDANGCTSTSTTVIDVNDPVELNLFVSKDSVCKGDRVVLYGNISGGVGSPYTLTNQTGEVVTLPIIFNVNNDTTFIITATDACGSQDEDTAIINIYPMPFVMFAADTTEGCQPFTVNFNISEGADEIHDYIWNFGDNDEVNLSLGPNPSHTYDDYGVYTVTLMYITNKGCKDTVQLENMITVYKKPNAEFINNPQVGTVVNSIIDFINLSEDNYYNFWSFGDGDSSIQVNPRHRYPSISGSYQAILIVESDKGCKDTAIANIEIQDVPVFYAPTAFTPDGDGINEVFYVIARNIDTSKEFYLGVYDRWGELIWATDKYDITNPSRYGWDGTVKGGSKQAPPDVYVWRCVYYTKDGNSHVETGNVTLMR